MTILSMCRMVAVPPRGTKAVSNCPGIVRGAADPPALDPPALAQRLAAGYSLALLSLVMTFGSHAAEKLLDFSRDSPHEIPQGFRSAVFGEGPPGHWEILWEELPSQFVPLTANAANVTKRPVLAQLSREKIDEHFPVLIFDEEEFGDFTLTTRFKIVDGVMEQMAGLAFRIQDEKNYYYVRASALGKNLRFFKVANGLRNPPVGTDLEIAANVWHELSVECAGNRIRIRFNGEEALPELNDQTFRRGKFAFWTKSDSVSYFAGAKIVYTPLESLAQVIVRELMKKYPRMEGLGIYARKEGKFQLVGSDQPEQLGQLGGKLEQDVLERGVTYQGRGRKIVVVTLPLRDRNGDPIAAVRVEMKSFPGQTEQNALVRALPLIQHMEARVRTAKDLVD